MTPNEIKDLVAGRFPFLMYKGYRPEETPETDGEGKIILWPNELKAVLTKYGNRAGIRKTLWLEGEDIDAIDHYIDQPADYRALETCQDNPGVYIRTKESTRMDGETTIKIIKFYPRNFPNRYPESGWEYVKYPIRLSYFVKLAAIPLDEDLPETCDTDLLADYLEAMVGEIDTRYIAAMEMNDTFEMKQKEYADYVQLREKCEELISQIRILPSAIATG
ncbi:hypothetical protein KKI24_27235 [bacterium]|nr:hypothetical protein [bacterium]